VSELAAEQVERDPVPGNGGGIGGEGEPGVGVDEAANDPGARDSIDARAGPCHPEAAAGLLPRRARALLPIPAIPARGPPAVSIFSRFSRLTTRSRPPLPKKSTDSISARRRSSSSTRLREGADGRPWGDRC